MSKTALRLAEERTKEAGQLLLQLLLLPERFLSRGAHNSGAEWAGEHSAPRKIEAFATSRGTGELLCWDTVVRLDKGVPH